MRAVDGVAEGLLVRRCSANSCWCSPTSSRASICTTRFCGPTRSRGCRSRSWRSSAARSPIAAAITPSFASLLNRVRAGARARLPGARRYHRAVRRRPGRHRLAEFIASSWGERTPILQVPAALIALPLPLGMALLALYRARQSRSPRPARGVAGRGRLRRRRGGTDGDPRRTGCPCLGGDAAIIVALALFFIAILAGVPVGFVLLLATAAYLWTADAGSFVVLPQTMVNGTGNFILLGVPFFILAGLIMERGGISVRLVRFIQALVGHLRGGLLQVTVASMYVVSGLSGSKPADVAAVGTVMRDQLRERHGAAEGAAVLAASAIMGETVPPSIAMLIVGSITSVSVAAMFIGGLMPAAVMALCLMALIYVRARRAGTPREPRAPWPAMARAGLGAILPLLMPAMLLGGILFGVATPTEVAAFAVLYGLVLAILVYREMNLGALRTVPIPRR